MNTQLWVPVWLTGVQINIYLSDGIYKGMAEQSIAEELPSVKNLLYFTSILQSRGGKYAGVFIATIMYSSCDCLVLFSPSEGW